MNRNIKALISGMSLGEKAGLCSGLDFWNTKPIEHLGIPSVMMSDGPHGLRKQTGSGDHLGMGASIEAVCFPAACATASSFDTELMRELGKTLGNVCQAENVGVLLGPAVNIKRSPLCGRNFEYISEDPYLTGKMAAAYIQGVQSQGVGTSIKHFAANNQEFCRMSCSSELSERTLREIYLPGFEEAVKSAQPRSVMCSYNKINGTYSSENHRLLTEILRDEWGFEGCVVTDWGAVADRVKGLAAGLDLEMPSGNEANTKRIIKAVKDGILDEATLNTATERILKTVFAYADNRRANAECSPEADHEKAVQIATECAVLLENNGVLPLKKGTKAAYIGSYAETPRFQGGGSSHINCGKVSSALASANAKGRNVTYVPAFAAERDEMLENGLEQAIAAAKTADVAVIFAGLPDSYESEGFDRAHMRMPECQDALIAAVAAVQPNTVVVLHNGSPVECPWANNVAAVLEMYLGGQGVGEACDRLLWGESSPCGHLAESFPIRLEDNPSYLNYPGDGLAANYAEGIYVGYRYYEAKKMPVRWAFGHGLSYTSFAYDNLRLSSESIDDDSVVSVSVDVKNTGAMPGKEVVQLYVSDLNGTVGRPIKELKGFCKVELRPGQAKTVSMTVSARDLSFYHEKLGDWYAPSGKYRIHIGQASDKILLTCDLYFSTKKLLPMVVTSATTIGELSGDSRTAPVLQQLFGAMGASSGSSLDFGSVGMSSAMESMAMATPLKTLTNFGIITPEQESEFIDALNALLNNP